MWVQLLDAILNTPLWINMDNVTAIQTHLGGSLIVTNAPTSASSPTSFAVRESPETTSRFSTITVRRRLASIEPVLVRPRPSPEARATARVDRRGPRHRLCLQSHKLWQSARASSARV